MYLTVLYFMFKKIYGKNHCHRKDCLKGVGAISITGVKKKKRNKEKASIISLVCCVKSHVTSTIFSFIDDKDRYDKILQPSFW